MLPLWINDVYFKDTKVPTTSKNFPFDSAEFGYVNILLCKKKVIMRNKAFNIQDVFLKNYWYA